MARIPSWRFPRSAAPGPFFRVDAPTRPGGRNRLVLWQRVGDHTVPREKRRSVTELAGRDGKERGDAFQRLGATITVPGRLRRRRTCAAQATGGRPYGLSRHALVPIASTGRARRRTFGLLHHRPCWCTIHTLPSSGVRGLLTYMSMRDLIQDAVERGLLTLVEPTMPSDPMIRDLYASPAVYDLVTGPWANKEEEVRCGRLRADFDRFVTGRVIPAALNDPDSKQRDAYLCRLIPAENEVWEIRSRAPRPGIRVFGRFADTDCFVALNWGLRKNLGGRDSREFKQEVRNCLAAWRKAFPSHDAFKGETIDEYVSEKSLPV